jgi:hypothetical protein
MDLVGIMERDIYRFKETTLHYSIEYYIKYKIIIGQLFQIHNNIYLLLLESKFKLEYKYKKNRIN